MGNRSIVGTGCFLFVLALFLAQAEAVVINFDVDANGNPLTATSNFITSNPLRNEYASLGVTFSGPSALDGGAILNTGANFGVAARSLPNFLAFNRASNMQNGGVPRDPETLDFPAPASDVTIFASGGGQSTSFRMDAFDQGNTLLGSVTQSNPAGGYAQLTLSGVGPVRRIVLTEIGGDNAFVYDDLTVNFIPEPAAVGAVLGCAGMVLRRYRRRG